MVLKSAGQRDTKKSALINFEQLSSKLKCCDLVQLAPTSRQEYKRLFIAFKNVTVFHRL